MSLPSHTLPDEASNDALDALLADLEIHRSDDRSFLGFLGGLFSVSVAVIGGEAAFLFRSCALAASDKGCVHQRNIYVLLPLLPLATIAMQAWYGLRATLGSFYIRALEREIHHRTGQKLQLSSEKSISSPGFFHLLLGVVSQRQAPWLFRGLQFFPYACLAALAAAITVQSLRVTESIGLRVGFAVGYSLAGIWLIAILWYGSFGGRALWTRLVDLQGGLLTRPLTSAPGESISRELFWQLVIPRRFELTKAAFVAIAIPIGAAVTATGHPSVVVAILALVAIELVVYQARYLWNDVRGANEDAGHAFAARRGRLGDLTRTRVIAVICAIVLRFTLWVAIAAIVGGRLGRLILVAGLAVFLLGGLYEWVRDRTRRIKAEQLTDFLPVMATLYGVVGLGYALRVSLGLLVGGQVKASLVCATALWASSLGSMFVTMTWAIEGMALVTSGGDGAAALRRKPHLAPLLRWARRNESAGESGRPLLHQKPWTFWDCCLVVALAAGGVTGTLLAAGSHTAPSSSSLLAVGGLGIGLGLVAITPIWRGVKVPVLLVLIALEVVLVSPDPGWPAAALLFPTLVSLLLYIGFRAASYGQLVPRERNASRDSRNSFPARVAHWIMGDEAWRVLPRDREDPPTILPDPKDPGIARR